MATNMNTPKLKEALLELSHLKGASKNKTTTKEYEPARHSAFEKINKMVK